MKKPPEMPRVVIKKLPRRKLPETRAAIVHKFKIGEHKGYINVGLYKDGTPGEIFITMSKEGSTIGGLMDTIALLTSLSLQHGVPLDTLVRKFSYQRFEPSGHSTNTQIGYAHSIVDYIFRWLGHNFIPNFKTKPVVGFALSANENESQNT